MKKILTLFIMIAFMSINSAAIGSTIKEVTVPAGTNISYVTTKEVNSKKLKIGDKIPVKVDRNVYAGNNNNVLVFKKDAPGYLYIEDVIKAKRMGKAGHLILANGAITDVAGIERPVSLNVNYGGQRRNWALVVGAIGLDTIIGAPLALFWLVKGHNVIVVEGTHGTAQIPSEYSVNVEAL